MLKHYLQASPSWEQALSTFLQWLIGGHGRVGGDILYVVIQRPQVPSTWNHHLQHVTSIDLQSKKRKEKIVPRGRVWFSPESDAHHFAYIRLAVTWSQLGDNSLTRIRLENTVLLYTQVMLSAWEDDTHRYRQASEFSAQQMHSSRGQITTNVFSHIIFLRWQSWFRHGAGFWYMELHSVEQNVSCFCFQSQAANYMTQTL